MFYFYVLVLVWEWNSWGQGVCVWGGGAVSYVIASWGAMFQRAAVRCSNELRVKNPSQKRHSKKQKQKTSWKRGTAIRVPFPRTLPHGGYTHHIDGLYELAPRPEARVTNGQHGG